MNRTFVICKPDAVERGLVGEIIRRIESEGLRLVAVELRQLDDVILAQHYEEHVAKPFYPELVSFMSRSPAVLLVVEDLDFKGSSSEREVFSIVRSMMGHTDPEQADEGTIRGDLAFAMPENLVHGSDSIESADREIRLFFPDLLS